MRVLPLAVLAFTALTGAASATGSITCTSQDGASIDLGIGTVPGFAVISAEVSAGGKSYSLPNDDLALAQAFGDSEKILVDFTDARLQDYLVRLRLFRANEGRDYVTAGTLAVIGVGAYAVTCLGP